MSELPSGSPFRYNLVSAGFDSNALETFTEMSDAIVRNTAAFGLSGKELIDSTARFKAILDSLNDYGFETPRPHFVIGKDLDAENEQTAYVLCDRVYGVSLDHTEAIPANIYTSTVRSLIDYYDDVATNGGDFIDDLDARQFMYGTTAKDPTPRTYLVDLDMNLLTYGTPPDQSAVEALYCNMNGLAMNINNITEAYGIDAADMALDAMNILRKLPFVRASEWKNSQYADSWVAQDILGEVVNRSRC